MAIVPTAAGLISAPEVLVPTVVGGAIGEAIYQDPSRLYRWPVAAIRGAKRGVEALRSGLSGFEGPPPSELARRGFVQAQRSIEYPVIPDPPPQPPMYRAPKRARVYRPVGGVAVAPVGSAMRRRRTYRSKYRSGPRGSRKVTARGPMKFSPTTYCPPLRIGGNVYTKLKTAAQTPFTLNPAQYGVETYELDLCNLLDPLGDFGAARPIGAVEYEAMFQKYRVHMTKIRLSLVHTTADNHLDVLMTAHTFRGDANPNLSVFNTCLNSITRVGGLHNFGNIYHKGSKGVHGWKGVFFPHKILGRSKKEYNQDNAFAVTKATGPTGTSEYSARVEFAFTNSDVNAGVPTSLGLVLMIQRTDYVEYLRPLADL